VPPSACAAVAGKGNERAGTRVPPSGRAVRDSKDREGPVLVLTPDEWPAFTAGVRGGDFDLA
jgi:hypothetical protein